MPLPDSLVAAVNQRAAEISAPPAATPIVPAAAPVAAPIAPTAVDNSAGIAQNNETNSVATTTETVPAAAATSTGEVANSEAAQTTDPVTGLQYDVLAQRFGIPVESIRGMQSEDEVKRAVAFRDQSIAAILPRLTPQPIPQPSAVDNPAAATTTAQTAGTVLPEVAEYQASLEELKEFDPVVHKAVMASHKAAMAQAKAEALAEAEKKYGVELKSIKEREEQAREAARQEQMQKDSLLLKNAATKLGIVERLGWNSQPGPQHQESNRKFFEALKAVQTIDNSTALSDDQIQRASILAFGPVSVPATTGQQATTAAANAIQQQSAQRMGRTQVPTQVPAASIPFTGAPTAENFLKTPAAQEFFAKIRAREA